MISMTYKGCQIDENMYMNHQSSNYKTFRCSIKKADKSLIQNVIKPFYDLQEEVRGFLEYQVNYCKDERIHVREYEVHAYTKLGKYITCKENNLSTDGLVRWINEKMVELSK